MTERQEWISSAEEHMERAEREYAAFQQGRVPNLNFQFEQSQAQLYLLRALLCQDATKGGPVHANPNTA